MATNITQKDKTLQEVIEWCESELSAATATYLTQAYWRDTRGSTWNDGRIGAYKDVIKHCKDMLGYGGSMPTEVPNQAEDAK